MPTSPMWRVDAVITGPPGAPYFSRVFFDATGITAAGASVAFRSFWASIAGVIGSGTSINVQSTVYTVDPVTNEITAATPVTTPTVVNGSASEEKMPFANQGLLTWDTGVYLGGRRLRGRTFIPTMTQAANNAGETIAAYRATVDAAGATLRSSSLAIYSPTRRVWHPAASAVTSHKIAILRSRRD